MSAISLGTLLYQFINIGFPDPVQRQYESMQVEENLRWGAAMLIIFLPVYVIMDRKVSRLRSANPDHGRSGVRRWRSEEHTSELQSLMSISYAVSCLKNNIQIKHTLLTT